ncbi:sulfate adenylyltransferase subunit 1 [Caldimonas tepidiphila]|uniref:sulfate adenylyltransferase subunit 1 n=1 Tax=Caldimonas tepidiphila TaxID=2315841 RepID=UPI000E5B3658|nr:GTP-binding protein [Caldimonas tepidiphila]
MSTQAQHIDAGEELAHKALRFLTAGSVDDGKSTLIGRLLFDSRGILADQLDALEKRAAGAPIDLSLLTDGLEAEREQGITIDVAYRYFATKKRKFIIADAPGHEQYTRNMVTAAAGSDAAVVLVDITKLDTSVDEVVLLPQTRRHSLLARLLRVPTIVFAINKLDAIETGTQAAFEAVAKALTKFALEAGITVKGIVPVSALRGDNVATPSANWEWYSGPTLLQILENLPVTDEAHDGNLLVPVQYVARDDGEGTGHQHRVMWGRIAHGAVKAGDTVQIFPSGETAIVAAVRHAGVEVDGCEAGQSAGIVLDRQVDVSRGDWIFTPGSAPTTQEFRATLAWLDTEPAVVGRKYWVRHGNRWVQARITGIDHRLDIHTLDEVEAHQLGVNEIGLVTVQTQQPLPVEAYEANRVGGSLIVVDPATNRTSGALLVKAAA